MTSSKVTESKPPSIHYKFRFFVGRNIQSGMSFKFHKDRQIYFEHQRVNAEQYVIPFIERTMPVQPGMLVLEIGCGEGGVLKAFIDHGCLGCGVELSPLKFERAKEFLAEDISNGKCELICADIYDTGFDRRSFDLIILKDVIEHIHDQPRLLERMKAFLHPGGAIFLGFPPWQMPFGGHQQICRNKLLGRLPYYHLLPTGMYKSVLKAFKEEKRIVNDLLEIKETGISIGQFERIVKSTGYKVRKKQLFLINPIYRYKFGLQPRKQWKHLGRIPYVRNFVTTCAYYVICPVAESPSK